MDDLDLLRQFRAQLAADVDGAQTRVAANLASAVASRPGSRRGRRRAILVVGIAVCALALAAISGAAGGVLSLVGVTSDDGSSIPISGTAGPAAFVLGNELHDASGIVHHLSVAAEPASGFTDALTAASGQVIYEAAGQSQDPSLRLFDPATNSDSLIATDASAAAWRRDGALAYAEHKSGASPGETIVEVRTSPTGPAVAWSGIAGYTPLAWAADTLIVEQRGQGGVPTLLAFSGPNSSRVLAQGALIAISPDGAQILIAVGASPDGIPSSANLRLIGVASGNTVGSLDLGSVVPDGLEPGVIEPGGPGDWSVDKIVFPAPAGVVVLDDASDHLSLARVLRFTGDSVLRGAEYHEARYLGASDNSVVVKAIVVPHGGGAMLPSAVVCTIDTGNCSRGSVASNPTEPPTLLYNESRPST